MASIDLQDAYFTVPLHQESIRFFRFVFDNVTWEFNCLPLFGLSTAPYVFTKIMRPVIAHFRATGIQCVNYLDDILILGSSEEDCQANVAFVVNLLQSLGFIIIFEKSSLVASKRCKFLGFLIDSSDLRLGLPLAKKQKVLKVVLDIIAKSKCRISYFAYLISLLVAVCPAAKYCWLVTKNWRKLNVKL